MRVDRAEQEAVVERFVHALTTGDQQALLEVLAPDVVLVADSGGVVSAIRQPVVGATSIVRAMSRFGERVPDATVRPMWLNGALAARIDIGGALDTAISLVIEGGRISRIYAIRNPRKLHRLGEDASLRRETMHRSS